jgi:hypothetical protein
LVIWNIFHVLVCCTEKILATLNQTKAILFARSNATAAKSITFHQGIDVKILKIFSPKKMRKNWRFDSKRYQIVHK